MVKINWSRVVLGGLLGGVVFNVLWSTAWILFLRSDWMSAVAVLGRTFPETPGGLALWLLLTFGGWILAIWLYATLSRTTFQGRKILVGFGPGPRTAAGVGFLFWLTTFLAPTLWWAHILSLPTELVVNSAAVGLVAGVVSAVVGAWPYKEE